LETEGRRPVLFKVIDFKKIKTFNIRIFLIVFMFIPFLKSGKGISSITCVLLLLVLTVLISGVLFVYLSSAYEFGISDGGAAVIRAESFVGGSRYVDSSRFADNVLVLRHAGGPPLLFESVSV
jgi:hypothetical protein